MYLPDLGILFQLSLIDEIGLLNWCNWSLYSIFYLVWWSIGQFFRNWTSGFSNFGFFLLETLCSSQFREFELSFTAFEHASWHLTVHASNRFLFYFFRANLQSAIGFSFYSFCFTLCLYPYPSTMPKKTRTHRTPSTSSESPSRSELFQNDKSRELYEKLNSKRTIWAERSVVLDEVDPTIRANFESKG